MKKPASLIFPFELMSMRANACFHEDRKSVV